MTHLKGYNNQTKPNTTEKSFIPTPQYEKEPIVPPRGRKLITGIGLLAASAMLAGTYSVASNNTTEALMQQDIPAETYTEVALKNIDEVKVQPGDTISSLVGDYVDIKNNSTTADYIAFDATVDSVVVLNKDGALADNVLQVGENVLMPNKAVVTDYIEDIND